MRRAICLSFQGKRKGQHHQHSQQNSLFVIPLAATSSIPTPISWNGPALILRYWLLLLQSYMRLFKIWSHLHSRFRLILRRYSMDWIHCTLREISDDWLTCCHSAILLTRTPSSFVAPRNEGVEPASTRTRPASFDYNRLVLPLLSKQHGIFIFTLIGCLRCVMTFPWGRRGGDFGDKNIKWVLGFFVFFCYCYLFF